MNWFQLLAAVAVVFAALYFGGRQVLEAFQKGYDLGRTHGYRVGWLDGQSDAVGCYHGQTTVKAWLEALDRRRLQRFGRSFEIEDDGDDGDDDDDPDDGEPVPEPLVEAKPVVGDAAA